MRFLTITVILFWVIFFGILIAESKHEAPQPEKIICSQCGMDTTTVDTIFNQTVKEK